MLLSISISFDLMFHSSLLGNFGKIFCDSINSAPAKILIIIIIIALSALATMVYQNGRTGRYLKSLNGANQYPEYKSHFPHHAIVFPHYDRTQTETYIEDAVFLIIEELRVRNTPFKVYHLKCKEDFYNMFKNENAVHLWLLGHGNRGGLNYGNDRIDYSELEDLDVNPKTYVHQLHCNGGKGRSLIDVNRPADGTVLWSIPILHWNTATSVRKYIVKYFKEKCPLN